jgi:hypothetical protein
MDSLVHVRPRYIGTALLALASLSFADDSSHYADRTEYVAPKALHSPLVDGIADDYDESIDSNQTVALTANKTMGLMVACNDGSELRENFVGSESVVSGPKDRGWIDAGLFGALILAE